VYFLRYLLGERVEGHPSDGNPGEVEQAAALHPIGWVKHSVADSHIQVKAGKCATSQTSVNAMAYAAARQASSFRESDQELKAIPKITLCSNLQVFVDLHVE
jgi:hypothetical protein